MRVHHAFSEPSRNGLEYDGLTSCGRESEDVRVSSEVKRVVSIV